MGSDYFADRPLTSEAAAERGIGMNDPSRELSNSSKSVRLPNNLSKWEAQWIISQMERHFLSKSIGKISRRRMKWEQFCDSQSDGRRRYSTATYKEIYRFLRRKAFQSMTITSEIRLIRDYVRKCNRIFVINADSPMITNGNSLYFQKNIFPRLRDGQPGQEPRLTQDMGMKEFSSLTNAEQQMWNEMAAATSQTCSDKFAGILSHQKLEFLDDMELMDLLHFAIDQNISIDPIVTGFDRYFAFRHDQLAVKYPGDEAKIRSKLLQKFDRMSEENRIEWEKPLEEDVEALRNKIRQTILGIMINPGSNKLKLLFPEMKMAHLDLVNKCVKSETLEERLARLNLHLPKKPAKTVFRMFHEEFMKRSYFKLPPDAKPCEPIQDSSSTWQNLSEAKYLDFGRQWTKKVAEYHIKISEIIAQIDDPSLIVEIKEMTSDVPTTATARKRKNAAIAYQRKVKRQRLNDVSSP